MRITLATATGVLELDGAGHTNWMLKGDARVVATRWAIVDDALVAIDEPHGAAQIDPTPLCLADSATGVVVGTARARLLTFDAEHGAATPVDSFDEIPSRDQWYTPWGGPPDTRSLAVDDTGTVFVNVHVGGVWRGDDDGSWTEIVGRDDDTHQVLATGGSIVVAAAVGFGQSNDGRSFRWTTDGLHATYCRAVAVAGDHVLLTASTGPFSNQGAVYRRRLDSDDAFVKCTSGLPEWFDGNVDTFQLAARGSDVALGTHDGRVFVSDDAGASWELLTSGVDPIRGVAVG